MRVKISAALLLGVVVPGGSAPFVTVLTQGRFVYLGTAIFGGDSGNGEFVDDVVTCAVVARVETYPFLTPLQSIDRVDGLCWAPESATPPPAHNFFFFRIYL